MQVDDPETAMPRIVVPAMMPTTGRPCGRGKRFSLWGCSRLPHRCFAPFENTKLAHGHALEARGAKMAPGPDI